MGYRIPYFMITREGFLCKKKKGKRNTSNSIDYVQTRKIIFVIAIVPRLNDSIFTFVHHVSQYPIILIRNHRGFGCSSFIYLLGCYSFTITRQKPTLHAFRALIRLQRELCDKHEFCWNLTTLTRGPPTTEFLRDMMNIVTSIIFSSFRPIHF